MEFIFMLTHHDVTIPNALQVFDEVKDTGLKCIGCKDIGLKLDQYKEQIIKDRQEAEKTGINGINLLLYRYTDGSQKKLLEATKKLKVPLIVAGNVANFDQINELKENNVWAFTYGGAILERKFAKDGATEAQIRAVLGKL